jgi:hypothetical protein
LFDAVARGDLVEIEDLLRWPNADINVTLFSENLLMCAIRNKQEKVAEYLINKGINVTYETNFIEFIRIKSDPGNVKSRNCIYSCRELAYENKLMNIVNLIDIFNENTDKRLVRYLGRRLLKNQWTVHEPPITQRDDDESLRPSRSIYEQRMEENYNLTKKRLNEMFLSDDAKFLNSKQIYNEQIMKEISTKNEINSLQQLNTTTTESRLDRDEEKYQNLNKKSDNLFETLSLETPHPNRFFSKNNFNNTIERNLEENIMERINNNNSSTNLKNYFKRLHYDGFVINYVIEDKSDDDGDIKSNRDSFVTTSRSDRKVNTSSITSHKLSSFITTSNDNKNESAKTKKRELKSSKLKMPMLMTEKNHRISKLDNYLYLKSLRDSTTTNQQTKQLIKKHLNNNNQNEIHLPNINKK